MIPESRSPTTPPTSHLPLPAPSELPACSAAWGRVRGEGWTEDIHEYPGSWSEPASSPELLSGAGGRPPTPDTRSGVQLLTWPTVFRETAFVRPVGRKPRNDMASAPAFPLQAVRGPRRLPIQDAPLTTSAPIPPGSTPPPSPRQQGSQCPTSRTTVPWPPHPSSCSLSWGDVLGVHLAHQPGAPEAWVWPV